MHESESTGGDASRVADLWRYYGEHAQHARDHEGLRATVSSTLAAIAAAVVGLAGVGGLSKADVPAGLVVVALSSLGVALSIKHYERFKMHSAIMREVRKEIDRIQGQSRASDLTTGELRERGEDRHAEKFGVFKERETPDADVKMKHVKPSPWIKGVRLHILWLGLPVSVGLVGVVVIILSFTGVPSR